MGLTYNIQKIYAPVDPGHGRKDGYILARLRWIHLALHFLRFSRFNVANHRLLAHGRHVQRPCQARPFCWFLQIHAIRWCCRHLEGGCCEAAVSLNLFDMLDSINDTRKPSYMNMFLSTWTLLLAGLVFALPMIYLRVKEHTEIEDEALYVTVLKLYRVEELTFCFAEPEWTTRATYGHQIMSKTIIEYGCCVSCIVSMLAWFG